MAFLWALALLGLMQFFSTSASTATLVGWNNLGMHCTDGSDFSVFSILPHYNTIQAQLIVGGKLVTAPQGMTVTYEAVADPDGSINQTSIGKGNFYQYVQKLYGAALKPDAGLAGSGMPGPQNKPQAMRFDPAMKWFIAEGIPITPYDDAGRKNYYPLMRLTARDSGQRIIATTDIVLPVSDEMTCVICHGSGKSSAARPAAGWVQLADPNRDYKLNVLRLHDEKNLSKPAHKAALLQAGFSPAGLYRQVIDGGSPILCARCHASEALPGTGVAGVPPLTQAIHARHASVVDPVTLKRMDDTGNRGSCYRCHPGSETRCLRGVMGNTVASDGTMAIQCQSCHGSMAAVGRSGRTGWLEEPNCQSCHTGTAVSNNGQIRYASVFDTPGHVRVAVNRTFATTANTPAPGVSLYRFSAGHGGLQCSACHGSTHAEYPSSHRNDNLQSLKLQGHVGTLAECSVCHTKLPEKAFSGGPHGMHPVGQAWIEGHKDPAEHNLALCKQCHGTDLRGTVLSRSSADRSLRTEWGTKTVWRGFQIGCYACHKGPFNDDRNPNRSPVTTPASLATPTGRSKSVTLVAADADQNPLVLRIVSQPAHGTVALNGRQATYFPERGFVGTDTFTFAAWDGSTESNLGRVSITVTAAAAVVDPPSGTGLSLHLLLESDHVVLSWPTGDAALVVETSANLETGDWSPLAAEASVEGGTSYLTVPSTNVGQLFRLREP